MLIAEWPKMKNEKTSYGSCSELPEFEISAFSALSDIPEFSYRLQLVAEEYEWWYFVFQESFRWAAKGLLSIRARRPASSRVDTSAWFNSSRFKNVCTVDTCILQVVYISRQHVLTSDIGCRLLKSQLLHSDTPGIPALSRLPPASKRAWTLFLDTSSLRPHPAKIAEYGLLESDSRPNGQVSYWHWRSRHWSRQLRYLWACLWLHFDIFNKTDDSNQPIAPLRNQLRRCCWLPVGLLASPSPRRESFVWSYVLCTDLTPIERGYGLATDAVYTQLLDVLHWRLAPSPCQVIVYKYMVCTFCTAYTATPLFRYLLLLLHVTE